jgi:hypothetical protein
VTLCNAPTARLWTIAAMAGLLTGCGLGGSDGICPGLTLPEYSREMQMQAAVELDSQPRGSALRVIVNDAGELRARVRAVCR